MQVPYHRVSGLDLTSSQVENTEPQQLGAAPVLSFGSSEELLALVENQSRRDETLLQQVAALASPDVSALAFSDEVVQQLLAMLIKPEQPTVSQPVQLPVIAETPGTTNPSPPTKPCPNVLQTRLYPLCQQPPAAGTGTLSILTTPKVNTPMFGTSKTAAAAAVTGSDAGESRSWDSLLHLLMADSTSESRRNSTGSLRGGHTTASTTFQIPQVCCVSS